MADIRGGGGVRYDAPEIKTVAINHATSGDNTIVSAVAGKRIAVTCLVVISDGTVDVRFEDGAGGTAKTGQMPLQAREGFVLPPGGPEGYWWIGSTNTLLNLELSAAINVHGLVSYREID